MNMINPLRRFPMTFAALALLVSPLGCGSETHETPVAETPAMPSAVDGSATTTPASIADIAPSQTRDPEAGKIDEEVRRTAGDAKEVVGDVKGDVKNAVEGAEHKAEKEAKAIEEEARKEAEKALDNLLPSPKERSASFENVVVGAGNALPDSTRPRNGRSFRFS
jgi:uncharacterized protein YjbJ (UPF0337 family)